MQIERVEKLSKKDYLNNYILKNKPVIITDAMDNWDLKKFQPEALKKEFGNEFTQVYNDLFDLQNVATLENYLDKNFNQPEKDTKEYIRWYTKLKDVDFLWSDAIFDKLKSAWSHPYFLPNNSFLVPYSKEDKNISITECRFPYKGLFISGKGARTRLHRDPFNSNAILCQFYGEKEIYLYSPEQEKHVMNGKTFVNLADPDLDKFTSFSEAKESYHVKLSPGEIIFFPAGWFHDVTSISDSISITWNFVCFEELEAFKKYIRKHPDDDQLEIVRFFLKEYISPNTSVEDVLSFLEGELQVKPA